MEQQAYLSSIMWLMRGRMGRLHIKYDPKAKDVKHFIPCSAALCSFAQAQHLLHGAEETLDAPFQLQQHTPFTKEKRIRNLDQHA